VVRAVFLGEAMLELRAANSSEGVGWQLGYGGDTLNTAVHLARQGVTTAFMTALGDDPFSHDLKQKWQAEGIDVSLVLTDPARNPGLYAITTDDSGERSFTYWRGESAARGLFGLADIDAAVDTARTADLLGFSLISLAILPEEGREACLKLAQSVRSNGGKVAFDGNYRPRLWANAEEARHWRDRAIACADMGLPTLEDETALSGEGDAEAVYSHWRGLGCQETIVKLGAAGARSPDGVIIPPPQILAPVDTSGAGDAFNGGYLSARLQGVGVDDAIMAGHQLAGWCVMRRGAIPARD
jgi:2-dehydro-3-deoxygluconokinase